MINKCDRRCSECMYKRNCDAWNDKAETTTSGWDKNRFAISCSEYKRMIIYRPHRSTLDEAMKEAKEFISENEMKKHIVNEWHNLFSIEDIVIQDKSFIDERIGWRNSRYICINRVGTTVYDNPQCIGMCATDYKEEE